MMYGYYGWGFGWLWMLVFWGAIIWFIVWLVNRTRTVPEGSAFDVLRKRYAKGEISKKEFDEMKKEIS